MVHGLGGNALNWMAVGPAIARTHRAMAIDLAGFGQPPLHGPSATVNGNAQLVVDFIEAVIGEPVVVMGNSMGGHIAILEAASRPDWIHSMVLVDPAIPVTHLSRPEPLMLATMAALSVPGLAQTLLDRRGRALGCADPARVSADVVAAHEQLTRERDHLGRQNGRAFVQASRSIGIGMADPRFWSRVAAVTAPTLVIHGSPDRLIPPAAAPEPTRRRPDWSLDVLDGVGHVPMMETPDRFLSALQCWDAYGIAPASAAS